MDVRKKVGLLALDEQRVKPSVPEDDGQGDDDASDDKRDRDASALKLWRE